MAVGQGFALLSAMDPQYIQELIVAINPELESFIMRLFHVPLRDVVTSTSGVQKFIPIVDMVPGDKENTYIAFDAEPNALDLEVKRDTWTMKGKFSHEVNSHKLDLQTLGGSADEISENLVRILLATLSYKIDAHGFKVLQETTVNMTYDVTAGATLPSWKNNDAKIILQLEEVIDQSNGVGDLLVVGDNVARYMRRNKVFRDRDARIVAADGLVNSTAMASMLSNELGIDVAILDKKWFNTNVKGAPPTYQKLFENSVGLYSRDHIQAKKFTAMDEFHLDEYDVRTQTASVIGHRYVALHRVKEAQGGVVIQNALA